MKFDELDEFRRLLEQELKKNTAKKYYFAVKEILKPINFSSLSEIDPAAIERGLKELTTKNDVSAAKRGFEYMAGYFPELRLPENIGEISKHKRNCRKRTWKPLKQDKLLRTVNGLHNKKLKYAYRLMLATGLRVSEVEQLRKQDITFEDGKITLYIEDTKGGGPATVECDEPYLIERLPEFVSGLDDSDKVFYSASTMMREAGAHGLECHDLRRVYAKTEYRERIGSGMKAYEATGEVRELMRHKSCRTTKKYLRRKII